MTAVSEHKPATASWVDIGTDVEAAKRFYTALFGWDTMDAGPPEETGGYGFFTKGGQMVAGYGPQQSPGPPFWSIYFAGDAEATAKKVEAAGGTVVVPAMDVMSAGRMAVFQDVDGAFFSVWQAGEHKGSQLVRETGSMTWVELNTRDIDAAKRFYPAVFGWTIESHEGDMPYHEFHLGSDSVGGMMSMAPGVPAEVPSHWLVYFAVDDVDASSDRAKELGADLVAGPMDYPGGRFAVILDPQGAVFGLMKSHE